MDAMKTVLLQPLVKLFIVAVVLPFLWVPNISLAQSLETLVDEIQSTDPAIRKVAGKALIERLLGEYAVVLPLLLPVISSTNEEIRYGAVSLLLIGAHAAESNAAVSLGAVNAYISLLSDSSIRIRRHAATGLGSVFPNTPTAAEASLRSGVFDMDRQVRVASIRALGGLASPSEEVVSTLRLILAGNGSETEKGFAAQALGALGAASSVNALLAGLLASEDFVRQESARALGLLGAAGAPALATLQNLAQSDPDTAVQQLAGAAVFAIENANDPPDCSTSIASPNVFWPPNHEMLEVLVTGVVDPDGDVVAVTIETVSQDEAVNESGSGNTCPDAIIDGDDTAMIRSERAGGLDGRVYRLNFSATDGNGGSCSGTVSVCIPHEDATVPTCIEQPEEYDSTVCP